jgi:dihydroorotate dehydrogenase
MTTFIEPSGTDSPHRTSATVALLLANLKRRKRERADLPQGEIEALLQRGERLADLSSAERENLLTDIKRFCHVRDLPDVLSLSGVPVVYNFKREFAENIEAPWDRYPDGDGVTRGRRWSLFGSPIGYPIGVPASVLTANARYIEYYARQGFNVLTYKTVRSREWGPHPFPNWVYLEDAEAPLAVTEDDPPVGRFTGGPDTFPIDPLAFSTANSFGVPSERPEKWKEDVAETIARLGDGKLLIVSVMGSSEDPDLSSPEALADDFATVAQHAEEAGARVIELNLSCPNKLDPVAHSIDPPVCRDPELTDLIVSRVAKAVSPQTRLVAKLTWMRHTLLEEVLHRFAHRVAAVSGINTLPMEVVDEGGNYTFGDRRVAGVSGTAIREYGLDFVRTVTGLRTQHAWNFEIIGMGGAMNADDVRSYFRAGADAVQTATGAEDDPTLPTQLLREAPDALGAEGHIVLGVLEQRPGADLPQLASASRLAPSAVRAALGQLRYLGVLEEEILKETGRPAFRLAERTAGVSSN